MAEPVCYVIKFRCPRCGAPLHCDGTHVWCSFVGNLVRTGCPYGVMFSVLLTDFLTHQLAQQLKEQTDVDAGDHNPAHADATSERVAG